jgi:hypothetical protein
LKTDTPLNLIHCEIRTRLTGGHSDRQKDYFKTFYRNFSLLALKQDSKAMKDVLRKASTT